MIGGNTQSIRDQWLKQMEGFYEVEAQADAFLSHELIGLLVRFTHLLGKEISLYLARDGAVVDVTVGEPDRVDLPDIRLRRGDRTLSGVRCVHSHPGGDARPVSYTHLKQGYSEKTLQELESVREEIRLYQEQNLLGDVVDRDLTSMEDVYKRQRPRMRSPTRSPAWTAARTIT